MAPNPPENPRYRHQHFLVNATCVILPPSGGFCQEVMVLVIEKSRRENRIR